MTRLMMNGLFFAIKKVFYGHDDVAKNEFF